MPLAISSCDGDPMQVFDLPQVRWMGGVGGVDGESGHDDEG